MCSAPSRGGGVSELQALATAVYRRQSHWRTSSILPVLSQHPRRAGTSASINVTSVNDISSMRYVDDALSSALS